QPARRLSVGRGPAQGAVGGELWRALRNRLRARGLDPHEALRARQYHRAELSRVPTRDPRHHPRAPVRRLGGELGPAGTLSRPRVPVAAARPHLRSRRGATDAPLDGGRQRPRPRAGHRATLLVRRVVIARRVRAGGRRAEWTGPRRRTSLGAARRFALREERRGRQHVLHNQLRGALDRTAARLAAAQPVRLRGNASVERLRETLELDAVHSPTEYLVARRDE